MVIVPGVEVSPGWGVETVGPLILVIDAQPLFAAAISQLLGGPGLGARTVVAEGSEKALELLRAQSIDLVLCDISIEPMPLRDFMAEVALFPNPPPLMVLADPQDEDALVSAIDSEAAGLFTKDADPDQFLHGVRSVLAGHKAVGQNLMRTLLARVSGQSPSRTPSGLAQLSRTELDILTMVGAASSVQAIAEARGISQKTVRNHMANIYRKLDLRSRTQAMLCAARMGLTSD